MKRTISLLIVLFMLITPVINIYAELSTVELMLNALSDYTAEERYDLAWAIGPLLITDTGVNNLINRINNVKEGSTSIIDGFILDFLQYTDKETMIKYISNLKYASEDIRETYFNYFIKEDFGDPKDELKLSYDNELKLQNILNSLFEKYDGLEEMFDEDGITVGVCARFLKVFYDINGGIALLTDKSTDSSLFDINIISDTLKSKEGSEDYIEGIVKDFNNANLYNTEDLKSVLGELGIYVPKTFYNVTFEGGEGATGTAPEQLSIAEGGKFKLPKNTFSKEGYTFSVWSDSQNNYGAGAEYTMPSNDVTFTAQWVANSSGGTGGGGTGGGGSGSGGSGSGNDTGNSDNKDISISYTVSSDSKYQSLSGIVIDVKQYKDGEENSEIKLPAPKTLSIAMESQNSMVYKISDDLTLTPIKYSYYENGNINIVIEEAGAYLIKETPLIFKDVTGWGSPYVESLYLRGIINGKGENIFEPESNITREEFVKLIVSLLDLEDFDDSISFDDVNKDEWYYKYIMIGVKNGLIKGIGNNMFGVGQNITRQDMCVIINNAISKLNPEIKENKTIPDLSEISDYAKESVSKMYNLGIVSGDQNGYFKPQNNATRQEASKIIFGVLKLIVSSYE